MKFPLKHPRLKTGEVELRALTSADLPALEEIAAYRPAKDLSAKELLQKIDAAFLDQSSINWGVYVNGELAGTVGYYRGFENDTGEIGYVTRIPFRRKGITTQACLKIIRYAIDDMKLKHIVAYTTDNNTHSIAVLNKLNFEPLISDKPEYIKFQYKGS